MFILCYNKFIFFEHTPLTCIFLNSAILILFHVFAQLNLIQHAKLML
jgi:hypothetical protein